MTTKTFVKVAGLTGTDRRYNVQVSANLLTVEIIEFGETVSNSIDLAAPEDTPQEMIPYENTVAQYELSLETFKQINNLRSNELYSIIRPASAGNNVSVNNLVNMSSITKLNKISNSYSYNLHLNDYGDVHIFVKDVDGNFNDHHIVVYIPSGLNESNLTTNVPFDITNTFKHTDLLDDITVTEDTSYNNDDYYKFNVSTESYVEEVFLEQVRGITDRMRVKLTSGEGSFRVLKSSLEPGDELKVKVGFASYPGITSVSKTV